LQGYLQSHNADSADLCRIYERRISHLYYKIDYKVMEARKAGAATPLGSSLELLDEICTFIYNNDDTDRIRLRAILMRVYHLALHNEWYAARDLMLMSKTQETIHLADPSTQVLYNRAMVQLGIGAFRAGMLPVVESFKSIFLFSQFQKNSLLKKSIDKGNCR
jgi:translation initiation factor 3 subunit C